MYCRSQFLWFKINVMCDWKLWTLKSQWVILYRFCTVLEFYESQRPKTLADPAICCLFSHRNFVLKVKDSSRVLIFQECDFMDPLVRFQFWYGDSIFAFCKKQFKTMLVFKSGYILSCLMWSMGWARFPTQMELKFEAIFVLKNRSSFFWTI